MKRPLVDMAIGLIIGAAIIGILVFIFDDPAVRQPLAPDVINSCVERERWTVWQEADAIVREAAEDAAG